MWNMRKYNLTQAKIYVYDKATGKMVEKKKLSADNEIKALQKLEQANGPDELREALKYWTPEDLAKAGIV